MKPGPPHYAAILATVVAYPTTLFSQSAAFTVVSAANYQPPVAPDSLATIFGSNLARATASATLDANGQLPVALANTRVELNGAAASLIYVSPSQINFVAPGSIQPGTVTVIIRSTDTGNTQSSTATVQNTAPAIFSTDASGKGPGAILDAVTYSAAPFLVETPENGGSDLRTRLALYGTGVRYAGNPTHDPAKTNVAASVQAQGQDQAGNHYNFTVEYAGAAPGYFGLDQINIVLPPELDGAGAVSVSISAGSSSNLVSFAMDSLPTSAIRLAGITLSANFVNGGDRVSATLALNGKARFSGVNVSLGSSNPAAQPPALVTIPAGQTSVQTTIATAPVSTMQTAVITAQSGGVSQTASLEIDPVSTVQLSAFSVTPSTILGGRNLSATATLTGAAPGGGVSIQIASDNAAVKPPATVPVPFGNKSFSFPIPTSAVTALQAANITATTSRTSITAQITVVPALQLTLSADSVFGGNPVTATITLADVAPLGGAAIRVQSSDPAAQVPSQVSIPTGMAVTTFTITTFAVTAMRTVTVTITYAGNTQSAQLTLNPVGAGAVSSLTVSPNPVSGGTNATGTVTLTAPAPAGGAPVTLRSSSPAAAPSPGAITIAQGQTTGTFTVITVPVSSPQSITISATAGGVTKSVVLTVQ